MLTFHTPRTLPSASTDDVASMGASLRSREFARLDATGHAYLDYTGAALAPESLIATHAGTLASFVLGNPHAENPASRASTRHITRARERVLQFLDADPAEYAVVFTANASAALGLVGASYPFGPEASLVLSADNHNSVNGLREYATRAGASVSYLPLDASLCLDDPESRLDRLPRGMGVSLFAYPAQSNFSGVKHALSLVRAAQACGYRVLLDAAAFVPTSRLSLRDVPADFVVLSFYKMFGYPTGVGALVARRDALAELRRPWFAGGTVDFVSVQNGMHALRRGEEGFEDGTPNFQGIAAVAGGLDFLEGVGIEWVGRHAGALASELVAMLQSITHHDGAPAAHVYGPRDMSVRGGTVAFNVVDPAGRFVPYAAVERRCAVARVSVRGGCFCNPGASEAAFGFPAEQAGRCLSSASVREWSLAAFADCMSGTAVGAVRASFGMASNQADLWRLVSVVESFVDEPG